MHQLTPQQRIAAYEWAAERIEEGGNFLCLKLTLWVQHNGYPDFLPIFDEHVQDVFPELSVFDPTGTGKSGCWFGMDCQRRERLEARLFILGSCILMAEEEISKQGKK
jgi:hypothetical protein